MGIASFFSDRQSIKDGYDVSIVCWRTDAVKVLVFFCYFLNVFNESLHF